MEKHVIINVTSLQRDENGKDETISLETPGIYGEEGDMQYISYRETKLAGMEGTTTTLRILMIMSISYGMAVSCRTRSTGWGSRRSQAM